MTQLEAALRTRSTLLVASVVVLLLSVAQPAFAQDEVNGDVAFSYSVVKESGGFNRTLPAGFIFAVTGDLNKTWRFVGEFNGNYKTVNTIGQGSVRFQLLGYVAGVRFVPDVKMKARPFVQFLAGGERATAHQIGTTGSAVANGFAFQPGFGFDFTMTKDLDARAQFDYRGFRTGGVTVNDYRFAFGVMFPFGR